MKDDNALYKLAYGEDHELMPEQFYDIEFHGTASASRKIGILKIIRFLARRVYELESK